jgi:hypothetical protein
MAFTEVIFKTPIFYSDMYRSAVPNVAQIGE